MWKGIFQKQTFLHRNQVEKEAESVIKPLNDTKAEQKVKEFRIIIRDSIF